MGIQGLLPLLKSIMVPIHIKDLEGCSVAIDTYSWLHKGALSCSKDLCKSQPTSKHVDYCMHRVNLLRHYGVKPILVFDGGHLPMKNEQEINRARSRKENLARAIEHESCGNASAAYECYQKAVDISPAIAHDLIQVLKQENISYVVAPYEADAQMTFLAISKHVDAVITEDSDLIPFGCPRIIYKMDKYGQGVEFQHSKLQQNKELNLTGFTKQMILEMCILSGCDYLQSLPGMGLKKAHALIKKLKSYDKVIKHIKFSGIVVPPLYEESFRKAIMTFQHQLVYDPIKEDVVHLSDLPDEFDEDSDFLGPLIPQNLAKGIASGDIDPFTRMPIQGECVEERPSLGGTYNFTSSKSSSSNKKLDLPAQKNLVTNYFCFATVEAKREFRAPRVSPKHSNSISAIPHIDLSEEIVDAVAAGKPAMVLEPDSHDDMRRVKHSKHTIHPCIFSKKLEASTSLDAINGKTRVEKNKIVVRSRYFQHKSSEDNDLANTKSDLSDGDHIVSDASKNATSDGEPVSAVSSAEVKRELETRKLDKSRYFQHKNSEANDLANTKSDLSIGDDEVMLASKTATYDGESINACSSAEVKTGIETRKLNRSRYFMHNNQGNTNATHIEASNYETLTTKRKYPVEDNSAPKENQNQKYMRASQSLADQDVDTLDLDDRTQVTRDEDEKFGCNISHLGKYSEIAEKSMEKFISVISSFKYTSSGSRASGLRAPLKDIRNTFTKKSSPIDEISKFAYTHQNKPLPCRRP
uniref:exonuclease 1 n=1 Tax=Erigeron canadensis TaxID=72917 RepID=UPI001CB99CDF|nr:exonuclease 1 [Erigeron canadensis]